MEQEQPGRIGRRLAAIVAADVAGYAWLMGLEEETTHAKLTALLIEAVYPAIAEHGGRIVKNTGDGFLAEFRELQEARAVAQAGLALLPGFTISRYRASATCHHPAYLAGRERTYEGLRMAGVPEG